jgi:hypothetical protein
MCMVVTPEFGVRRLGRIDTGRAQNLYDSGSPRAEAAAWHTMAR